MRDVPSPPMKTLPKTLLMTPGPVPVPPEVLTALSLPIEHHRTKGFQKCLTRVLKALPEIFQTAQPAFLHTSTGSGGMESLLVNCLSPGQSVACVVSGKFGERWSEMATAYGAHVERFDVPWGESLNTEKFRTWLSNLSKKPDIVLSQACETSTGVLHPVRRMAKIIRTLAPDALFLVDAITALGAVRLPMDAWDLDGVVGGSQKAFMLPTGLSFVSFSERAWRKIPTATCPRFYFDIRDEKKANDRNETNFSSAVPLIRALDAILTSVENFDSGGFLAIQKRISALSRATRFAVRALGLETLTAPGSVSSPTLTAVLAPPGIDGNEWRNRLESQHGLVLMGGQDSLKGKIIRIGHMGYISDEDLIGALTAIAVSLNEMKPGMVSEEKITTALSKARTILKQAPMPWSPSQVTSEKK